MQALSLRLSKRVVNLAPLFRRLDPYLVALSMCKSWRMCIRTGLQQTRQSNVVQMLIPNEYTPDDCGRNRCTGPDAEMTSPLNRLPQHPAVAS